jgi:UDP-glucose 4-epimerase
LLVRVLITGGSGFIGRNVAEYLGNRYQLNVPTRSDLNLLDEIAVRHFLRANHFDVVIHCATTRGNRRLGSPANLLHHNCRMFFNLARNQDAFGKMLFCSSGAAYDLRRRMPRMPEEYFDTHVPADDYGFSKYICAKYVPLAKNLLELRLFAVFGPYEDWQVRFISNACCRAVRDLPIVIRQNAFFDFLPTVDVARIMEWFIEHTPRYQHYNVCSGFASELKILAGKVVAASGKRLDIILKEGGLAREYSGDNTRLIQEMGGFAFTDIDIAIAELYRWYLEHEDTIDPSLLHFDA